MSHLERTIVDFETNITPIIADTTPVVTLVSTNLGKAIVSTSSNLSRASTLVKADSAFRAHDPSYPQRLIETRLASQTESKFFKQLQNL